MPVTAVWGLLGDNAGVAEHETPPPSVPGPVEPPPLPPPAADRPAGRRPLLIVVLVLALLVGAGVGIGIGLRNASNEDASKLPPPSPVPAGWALKRVGAEGFGVALPPNWQDVPTSSADEALKELREANPAIASMVEGQLGGTLSAFIKLLAFDLESPTLAEQFVTNMNVVVAPVPAGIRFEDFVEANLSQLRSVPGLAGEVETRTVTVPAGQAAVVRSRLTLQGPGGETIAAITQYLLVRETRGYILSFSTTPTHEASYTETFTRIANTFRYL